MTKYDDLDWKELPQDVMEAAKKLGFDEKMWDKDKDSKCCDEVWDDLDDNQRQAAGVLGYTKETWDSED
eukprot:CAMPEP_0201865104 /NCGR_PEP_ID=MMETSP0902-20130614/14_1 /ASSEMBLY_ACC=CAM_ASM_000551 /TAXON_ID=420261 /ORGANISM="Thalassiosira antarctica, Strain CCMP982" /LENGTH=68 /DNA_ID=CAMNT_0048389745 /DNA_START=48 /DNA_END=254 /DNA_ORIENTATION=+